MIKFTDILGFAQYLFDEDRVARKAAHILKAMLKARSPRLSDISQHMSGHPESEYKEIQRFLHQADLKAALLRLFQLDAPFVLADPTEIPRPQARKTAYVGRLQDGKTRGFWLMLLATPFRGRALPFHFITYSSKTIAQQETSRNLIHCRAFAGIRALLGDRPLVLDREFSYLELLHNLVAEGVHFHPSAAGEPPACLPGQERATGRSDDPPRTRSGPQEHLLQGRGTRAAHWSVEERLCPTTVDHDKSGASQRP